MFRRARAHEDGLEQQHSLQEATRHVGLLERIREHHPAEPLDD